MLPIALTIAGSDPGGGAGIQADLKVFHRFGVYGTAAITLITVQNTKEILRVVPLDALLVEDQIKAVLEDLPPRAIKTGALGTAAIVQAISRLPFQCPLVVDPVMIGKHGSALADPLARHAFREFLLPRATLVTPNLDEAAEMAGISVENPADMREAARRIADLGVASVLVKGGHLVGAALDLLWSNGVFTEFAAPRIHTVHTHGTGCTLSAAITALLATGLSIEDAVAGAKKFVTSAIRAAPGLGSGSGPLNHWV